MVTPGRSAPAALTQSQVAEFMRGASGQAMAVLHVARKKSSTSRVVDGNAPAPLSAEEMNALARGERLALAKIAQRIAASTPARSKKAPSEDARKTRGPKGAAPSLTPPGAGKTD